VPLGASITQGWDVGIVQDLQNGYRKSLREELRHRGYAVNMVGSRSEGDFSDRQHEGWPGLEINDVAAKMIPVMTAQKPNLVLILLGSNDCFRARRQKSMEYARAMKDRMKTMIENIYSLTPNVTIILATLPPTRDAGNEPYIQTANTGFKELAQDLQREGRRIELVDMYTTWLQPQDYSDTIHFKPPGYAKLAALFAEGFSRVESKGWLTAPVDTGIPDNAGCYPSPGGFYGPIQTQQGSGQDDGEYTYFSVLESSQDFMYKESAPRALLGHFHFANLTRLQAGSQPSDDLVRVLDPEDRKAIGLPFVSYYPNRGNANFDKTAVTVEVHQECPSGDVRWGDVNGDGLDDFICLDANGIPHVSINRAGDPPKFDFIGAIREEKTTQSKVRLADIDGDGRIDFCNVEVNGVYCWRNVGTGDAPTAKYNGSWEGMLMDGGGTTLDLPRDLFSPQTRFVDINGDGRADWIYVHNDTHMDIRINQHGGFSDGKGLKPHWANAANAIEGWPKDHSVAQDHILFGRVFGSGRNDVIRMEKVGKDFDYAFHFYHNTGRGGTQIVGDGVRYCDMFGRGHDE
jgi:lysophospholipase L1-like esterase